MKGIEADALQWRLSGDKVKATAMTEHALSVMAASKPWGGIDNLKEQDVDPARAQRVADALDESVKTLRTALRSAEVARTEFRKAAKA